MAAGTDRVSVALAHHWLMSMRGGEKTVATLAEMFPAAPIYSLLARPEQLDAILRGRELRLSWLQHFNWIPDLQRKALPVLAAAARSLDARAFDAVICSDAAIIKAIRTRGDALKLCYCHSPMRYVWDLYDQYYRDAGAAGRLGLRLFAPGLREADRWAADGVTAFIANSRAVAERIRRNYGRSSVVIHPPVDVDFDNTDAPADDFYLAVGECVGYKRHDLAIDACTRLGRPLVVIGTGPKLADYRNRAGANVRILGWQNDATVRDHMRRCRALLFCGEEDFGLVPVEAQAAGRPVIAFRAGGAMETVLDGQTGVFFDTQSTESVIEAIERFESAAALWPATKIREHARQFSRERFRERFMSFYEWCVARWREGGPAAVREATQSLPSENARPRPSTIAERRFAEAREQLRGLPISEVFDTIYRSNLWGSPESQSGVGSQLDATARLRAELPLLLRKLGVETLLDIPCGDFSWFSTVQLPVERYVGADIVPAIIARNTERFMDSHPFAEFQVLDITKDPIPDGDALLCRDCLVHLPYSAIADTFRNITGSKIRYVILTTFIGDRVNTDVEPGDWRPLNFEKPPFSLPPPEIVLLEGCTEEDGAYADKALGVWSVEQLRTRFSATPP